MDYADLLISTQEAENIAAKLFGIEGEATKLAGEVDFNFRIKTHVNDGYILKISRPDEHWDYLDFQQQLLNYAKKSNMTLLVPEVVLDCEGNAIGEFQDKNGKKRLVRMLSWVSGRLWSQVNPQLDNLRYSLGIQCGALTKSLIGFKHDFAKRAFDWDLAQSLWTKEHLHLLATEEQQIVSYFQHSFESIQTEYSKLRKSVIHNDANDNNIVVNGTLVNPEVATVIDYGDAVYTQIINDLAIAGAYAIMGQNNPLQALLPLVKGYHESFPLEDKELFCLYEALSMRLVTTVTKSALNKIAEPDNKYLLISEKPAWEALKKWKGISKEFAYYSFRLACGMSVHPQQQLFDKWIKESTYSLVDLFPTINKKEVIPLDLSVSSTWLGHADDFMDEGLFVYKMNKLQSVDHSKLIAGGYLEPRVVYTTDAFDRMGNLGKESRTVHLGVDFWLPAETPIHALFEGEVVTAVYRDIDKDYGGLIILKHNIQELEFYTLYGHLSKNSVTDLKVGTIIKKGDTIGFLGDFSENGGWYPHLHFQIMHSLLDFKDDFIGVAYHSELEVWKGICPDPNLLFNTEGLKSLNSKTNKELINYRKEHLGKSMSLQYKEPLKIVRGSGVYLLDQFGRKYLDTVNNVAHVGHENYKVVKAGQAQMEVLNTNSRYLHDNINELAKELIATMPSELNVCHFVNSGSEANELAIRMVKAVTGSKDIIASEVGYHGNSNTCIDISSYKFDGKGGKGAPEHTHIFPLPDAFRGKYRGEDAGEHYATEVKKQIENIERKGRNVGGFIIESIISCGGQIELPNGFLKQVYEHVRNAGGICISDEVQVGCGRVGSEFWGFQLHDVVPDIVTIGKPLGNGHPVAAVVCTQEVADKFANGMEYFNTFGGNPVSSVIAATVLKTVKEEGLQKNALKVGNFLKKRLTELSQQYPIIGDVRGQGLFLGIELVNSELEPLAEHTSYLANRMKDHGILMSIDGPDHNVLKIKPPVVFSEDNAKELIYYLDKILQEDFMKVYE